MYIVCLPIIYFFTLCSRRNVFIYTFVNCIGEAEKRFFKGIFNSKYVRFSFSLTYRLAYIALLIFSLEIAVQYIP